MTHKEFCLQQEGVQGLLVKLFGLEHAGGAEQVLGLTPHGGHEIAEAFPAYGSLVCTCPGSGRHWSPSWKDREGGSEYQGQEGLLGLGALEQEDEGAADGVGT